VPTPPLKKLPTTPTTISNASTAAVTRLPITDDTTKDPRRQNTRGGRRGFRVLSGFLAEEGALRDANGGRVGR
jgi:hypothetical protein